MPKDHCQPFFTQISPPEETLRWKILVANQPRAEYQPRVLGWKVDKRDQHFGGAAGNLLVNLDLTLKQLPEYGFAVRICTWTGWTFFPVIAITIVTADTGKGLPTFRTHFSRPHHQQEKRMRSGHLATRRYLEGGVDGPAADRQRKCIRR